MEKKRWSKLKSKLTCNSPKRTSGEDKSWVVKGCEGGEEKIVRFGDPDMPDGTNNPDRQKSYCARSAGIKGGDGKLSANYWSRKQWRCKKG
jgi:hypothetical protein